MSTVVTSANFWTAYNNDYNLENPLQDNVDIAFLTNGYPTTFKGTSKVNKSISNEAWTTQLRAHYAEMQTARVEEDLQVKGKIRNTGGIKVDLATDAGTNTTGITFETAKPDDGSNYQQISIKSKDTSAGDDIVLNVQNKAAFNNVEVGGTLKVTGGTTLDGTLNVNNTSTFAANKQVTFNGPVEMNDDLCLNKNLIVKGTTTYVNTENITIEDGKLELNMVDVHDIAYGDITVEELNRGLLNDNDGKGNFLKITLSDDKWNASWAMIKDDSDTYSGALFKVSFDSATRELKLYDNNDEDLNNDNTMYQDDSWEGTIVGVKTKTIVNGSGICFKYAPDGDPATGEPTTVSFTYDSTDNRWVSNVGMQIQGDLAITGNFQFGDILKFRSDNDNNYPKWQFESTQNTLQLQRTRLDGGNEVKDIVHEWYHDAAASTS